MLVLMAWIEPAIRAVGPVAIPGLGDLVLEPIESVTGKDTEPRRYTLASLRVRGDDVEADLAADWQRVDDAISLLLLCEVSFSAVVAARVQLDGVPLDQPVPVRLYPAIPTSCSFFLPTGFQMTHRTCREVPALKESVRVSLGWLVRALRTFDTFERTLLLWVALESLAPELKSVPRCERCKDEHELTCPKCGVVPATPRVLKSIQAHLHGLIDKKSLRRLYDLRSKMVHGKLQSDAKSARSLNQQVMALTLLTIDAVKRELGWKRSEAPTFSLAGETTDSIVSRTEMSVTAEKGRKEPIMLELDPVVFADGRLSTRTSSWRRR
ncbi:MAG: hypothetical protein WAZ94_03930 [Phycisphaerales bacterium]